MSNPMGYNQYTGGKGGGGRASSGRAGSNQRRGPKMMKYPNGTRPFANLPRLKPNAHFPGTLGTHYAGVKL